MGAATGPYLAGLLYERPAPYRNMPFFIAGGLKAVYDLLLLVSFAAVRPPEEAQRHAAASARAPLKGQAEGVK